MLHSMRSWRSCEKAKQVEKWEVKKVTGVEGKDLSLQAKLIIFVASRSNSSDVDVRVFEFFFLSRRQPATRAKYYTNYRFPDNFIV